MYSFCLQLTRVLPGIRVRQTEQVSSVQPDDCSWFASLYDCFYLGVGRCNFSQC